jgi:D-alanyl-D-alanine carboxypeptidase
MPRTVVGLVALLVASVATGCSSSGAADAAASRAERADRALDRELRSLVAGHGGPPGAIVVVQRGGRPMTHAAGSGTVGAKTPIAGTDHLRIASVTKAYTGAVVLAVIRAGALSLDDTIGERLPGQPSAWHPVTLRQLLQHTSGVPDFSRSPAFTDAVRASLGAAPPPAQLLAPVAGQPLEFTPGTRYEYSNSDNVLAALMVEAATGQRFEDALADLVLRPAGLPATSLPRGTEIPRPTAPGYALDATAPPEDVTTVLAAGWAWAAGGIVSTPLDSNRFVRAYVRGRFTDAATRRAQLTFRAGSSEPPGPGANATGLSVYRYRTTCGTVYGHTGNTLGYTHFVAASRDGTRSAVVAVNAQIKPKTDARRFAALRRVFTRAVCAALA